MGAKPEQAFRRNATTRIAILTQYYPPESGAPQARLAHLAEALAAAGHEVTVLTAMPSYPRGRTFPGYGGVYRRETINGVTVVRTYCFPTQSVGLFRRLANYLSFAVAAAVIGLIAVPRVDYLLTESPPLFLGITGYLLSRVKGARWILNISDLWPESAILLGVIRRDSLAVRASTALETFLYRHANLITGQSNEILRYIGPRVRGNNTYHLSNGVDVEFFYPERRSETLRRELLSVGRILVMYAGLHGIAQGLDQILSAAARVPADLGLHFVLLGDGPERQQLRATATELHA